MTRFVFNGRKVEDYIDPKPEAFKRGTFMYVTPTKEWFRNGRKRWGAAPHGNEWVHKHESQVPKHLRAMLLLIE